MKNQYIHLKFICYLCYVRCLFVDIFSIRILIWDFICFYVFQMSAYFAPAFFSYLLGKCLRKKNSLLEVTKLGLMVIGTFAVVWWPYLQSKDAALAVSGRIKSFYLYSLVSFLFFYSLLLLIFLIELLFSISLRCMFLIYEEFMLAREIDSPMLISFIIFFIEYTFAYGIYLGLVTISVHNIFVKQEARCFWIFNHIASSWCGAIFLNDIGTQGKKQPRALSSPCDSPIKVSHMLIILSGEYNCLRTKWNSWIIPIMMDTKNSDTNNLLYSILPEVTHHSYRIESRVTDTPLLLSWYL